MAATIQIENDGAMGFRAWNDQQYIAQTFTPTSDFNVTHLVFNDTSLTDFESNASSDIVVQLQKTTGGAPNGTVIASGIMPIAGRLHVDNVNVTVTLNVSPLLETGTVYAMVYFQPDFNIGVGFDNVQMSWNGGNTDEYADGSAWYKNPNGLGSPVVANWTEGNSGNADYRFEVWGIPTEDGFPGGLPGAGVGKVSQGDATPTLPGGGDRPAGYNPDQVWNENVFVDIADAAIAVAGGGRWNIQTVFVGKDVIYFEEIT